jgi:hypothetical protein
MCLSELIHIFSDYAFVHVLLFSIIFICIARSSYPKVIPTSTFVARIFQYITSFFFLHFLMGEFGSKSMFEVALESLIDKNFYYIKNYAK